MKINRFVLTAAIVFFLLPIAASAHQPRIVTDGTIVTIEKPEISKAYYGKMHGDPQVFTITSDKTFKLHVGLTVPDMPQDKTDLSVAVFKDGSETPEVVLNGGDIVWQPFYEPFGKETYLKGPEFRETAQAGSYKLVLWSSNNDSVYVLATGETESFPPGAIIRNYFTYPQIVHEYFGQPAYTAFFTPTLAVPILVILIIVLVILVVIFIKRKRKASH